MSRILQSLSPNDDPSDPFILSGREAIAWFHGRRMGAEILDSHLAAVREVFGDRRVHIRSYLDPNTLEASQLVVEVQSDLSDADWDALVSVQEQLLDVKNQLADRTGLVDPLDRVSLVLSDLTNRRTADSEVRRDI